MTHIIAEPCIGTKDTACVDVCPVDCIHPTKDEGTYEEFEMLYIDPEPALIAGSVLMNVLSKPYSRKRIFRRNGRSTYRSMPTGLQRTADQAASSA